MTHDIAKFVQNYRVEKWISLSAVFKNYLEKTIAAPPPPNRGRVKKLFFSASIDNEGGGYIKRR